MEIPPYDSNRFLTKYFSPLRQMRSDSSPAFSFWSLRAIAILCMFPFFLFLPFCIVRIAAYTYALLIDGFLFSIGMRITAIKECGVVRETTIYRFVWVCVNTFDFFFFILPFCLFFLLFFILRNTNILRFQMMLINQCLIK